jgi:pimeloyl-ACP methyl ester carboxylesterase
MNEVAAVAGASEPTPFAGYPFSELPADPPLPHSLSASESRMIRVESQAFGALETHVRVAGSGPPLLLLHGLMTSAYSFRYVIEPLAARRTLYVPDLPGAGRTELPKVGRYTADALAAWIGDLLHALELGPADIAGNSLGGYLALLLALKRPSCVRRLAVMHAPGFPEPRLRALRAGLSVPGARSLLCAQIRKDPRQWVYRNVHYRNEALKCREEIEEYAAALSRPGGAEAFAGWLKDTLDPSAMSRVEADLAGRAQRGERPPATLLLWGDADPLVPVEYGARWLSLLPGARLVTVPGASHFLHVDAPLQTATELLRFFDDSFATPDGGEGGAAAPAEEAPAGEAAAD